MTYWHMQIKWGSGSTKKRFVDNAIKQKIIAIGATKNSFLGQHNIPLLNTDIPDYLVQINPHQKRIVRPFSKIEKEDIVLLRAGKNPQALIKVVADYFFTENIYNNSDYPFQHGYPVEIISTYNEFLSKGGKNFISPWKGTIGKLKKTSKTFKSIDDWLKLFP